MGNDSEDTCKFGHIAESDGNKDILGKLESGEITSWSQLESDEDFDGITDLFEEWRTLKLKQGSQGVIGNIGAVLGSLKGAGYSVSMVKESVFIPPQSQVHQEFMQRKQQAEQNIKQTMQSYQQLVKQKHMLQHDVRKLRSRVEAINSQDETTLKGDFIELVDSAGGGQGAAQGSLDFLRNNQIYPSIVADFQEMDSVEDLENAEQRAERYDDKDADDLEDGHLADLPRNEKAVLKKKYKMYEQWKDLYGSEISRKLDDLKGQLKSVERSLEETKEWLEPYVRDVNRINKMGEDQSDPSGYKGMRGNSGIYRELGYIAHKGFEKGEGGLVSSDDPTHYGVVYVEASNENKASSSQPQSPAEGSSSLEVTWHAGFFCKHVFENVIQERIDLFENEVEQMMEEYTGEFSGSEEGKELKETRNEEGLSVRDLRTRIQEELDEEVPIELSSQIRRIEDGLDSIDQMDEDYLEAIDEILDTSFTEDNSDGGNNMSDFRRTLKTTFGKTDKYYMDDPGDGLSATTGDLIGCWKGLMVDLDLHRL